MSEQERNTEVVRRYPSTFVTKDLGATAVQSACKMYRLEGGKIVQFWGEQDLYGLLCGLGMLAPVPLEF